MNVEVKISFENSIMSIEAQRSYIDLVLIGNQIGDLMGYSLLIESFNEKVNKIREHFRFCPGCFHNIIAMA
jgi:hypothetical protein